MRAFEKRIEKLETDKLVITEKITGCGRPSRDFKESFQAAMDFQTLGFRMVRGSQSGAEAGLYRQIGPCTEPRASNTKNHLAFQYVKWFLRRFLLYGGERGIRTLDGL